MADTGAPLALKTVILASASAARAAMLTGAGLAVDVEPAGVDEDEIKRSLRADGADCSEAALALAEHKARAVSRHHPSRLVIGADQILDCGGQAFDKPATPEAAAAQLRQLSGREHHLVSATAVVTDGRRDWHCVDRARLQMRNLSEAFIAAYIAAAGDSVLDGPGGYQVEGIGAHLFARIDGDHFTVLGMPLLPLLAYLRDCGAVRA